jgi:hypothetical protein
MSCESEVLMSQAERVRTKIQALDERLTRLRVAKSRLIARESKTERKRDTRRKILIGGAVLAAVEHEGVPTLRSKSELGRWLDGRLTREHDRAVFDLPARDSHEPGRHASPYERAGRSDAAVREAASGGTAPAARRVLDGRMSGGQ